jgi:hypothetical protein
MSLVRIAKATALEPFRLRLELTDGQVVERDVGPMLGGKLFERVRSDAAVFAAVRVESGTVIWPGGADLCPDAVIWGGLPPAGETASSGKPSTLTAHP